jgi:hypothetical protein
MNGRRSSGSTPKGAFEAHDGRVQKWDSSSVATKASMCGGGGPLHGRPVERSWAAGRILKGAARHECAYPGPRRHQTPAPIGVPSQIRPANGRTAEQTGELPETFRPVGFQKGAPCLQARKGAPNRESLSTGKVPRPWVEAHVANKSPTTLRAGKVSMENIGEIRGPIAEGKRDYGPFVSYFVPVSGTERLSRVGLRVIGTTTEPADIPLAVESEVRA